MPAMDYSRVAHLYDAYARADFDIPFFLEEARGASAVLELMAGTGRVSIPLAEAGVPLTCVDSSPEMLALLRHKLDEKGLSAAILEMDVSDSTVEGPFDLVILPFHSFSEILDLEDQRRALRGIRSCLADGGRFICPLHNPPIRLRTVDGRPLLRGRYPLPDGTLFLWAYEERAPGSPIVSGAQFYEIYDAGGALREKTFVDLRFYLHEPASFRTLVESEGFEVRSLYGDYARAPFEEATSPVMIWVLEKAGAG
ncbi:MAG TPA: class I SAM-dependent methyltransferase [Thermoanaerobaculia bacterium]|nr:class I SAM-dependent methyltransferase [Thermoanaerobaculia bacterium]